MEQSGEVPDQISTGCQNLVLKDLDLAAGSIGESVSDNKVE